MTILDEVDRSATLRDYVDKDLGFLNFFQINIVLESLFNANFDLTVFFYSSEDRATAMDIKKSHSLGEFIRAVSANDVELKARPSRDSQGGDEVWPADWHWERFDDDATRQSALDHFVRATSTRTLLSTKWRIERCRRALLDDLLGVVHRRQPVLQVESPDNEGSVLRGISEMQVRGYVMLLAAKLPLLRNVERYITREWRRLAPGSELRSELEDWHTLLDALFDNIAGLEATIAQASRDRLLYEEEQVRAEQEAAGELTRLQEHEGHGSSSDDISFSAAEVLLAFAALVFTLGQGFDFTGWSVVVVLPITLVLAPLVIWGLHRAMSLWFDYTAYRRFRVDPLGGRFLYEADVRADQEVDADAASTIFRGEQPSLDLAQVAPTIRDIKNFCRNSYRVERISEDESIHKVHVECVLVWSRTAKRRWHGRVDEMLLHLTYELMFHRPSDEPTYIVREVRALGTMPRRLSGEELNDFRRLVAIGFVNRLTGVEVLSIKEQRRDSMLALNR